MKAVVFKGPESLVFEEREPPKIKSGEILIEVKTASICGTDLKIYRGGHYMLGHGENRVLGHELAGDIVEVGANVGKWRVGQRVSIAPNIGCGHCDMCRRGWNNLCTNIQVIGLTADGAFQQYMVVPERAVHGGNLFEIPESLDYESASLIEPLSCCFNTWKRLQVTPEDRVIIFGTGPIGTFFLKLAKAYGARQVILVGIINERIKEIAVHGATHTINSLETSVVDEVMNLTGGNGVDVALTCVPVPDVQSNAVKVLALNGRLSLFAGLSKDAQVAIDTNRIHYNSLQVTGTTGSSIEDYARSLALVESGRISVKDLVTHWAPLEEANSAFVKALAGEALKTVFLPNGDLSRVGAKEPAAEQAEKV